MRSTEPTSRARSIEWIPSNSTATSPSFSERTSLRRPASAARSCPCSVGSAVAMRSRP